MKIFAVEFESSDVIITDTITRLIVEITKFNDDISMTFEECFKRLQIAFPMFEYSFSHDNTSVIFVSENNYRIINIYHCKF